MGRLGVIWPCDSPPRGEQSGRNIDTSLMAARSCHQLTNIRRDRKEVCGGAHVGSCTHGCVNLFSCFLRKRVLWKPPAGQAAGKTPDTIHSMQPFSVWLPRSVSQQAPTGEDFGFVSPQSPPRLPAWFIFRIINGTVCTVRRTKVTQTKCHRLTSQPCVKRIPSSSYNSVKRPT